MLMLSCLAGLKPNLGMKLAPGPPERASVTPPFRCTSIEKTLSKGMNRTAVPSRSALRPAAPVQLMPVR